MGKPAIDVVVIRLIKDPQTRILSLMRGEIDATIIDPVECKHLDRRPEHSYN
jgi:ABC-type transport system substrate-binding protein